MDDKIEVKLEEPHIDPTCMRRYIPGMRRYIGVKIIDAKPLNRRDYCEFRGQKVPSDENGDDEGHLVRYEDDYVSWSPADPFSGAYRRTDGMPFGLALEAMRKGLRVRRTRAGWGDTMIGISLQDEHFSMAMRHGEPIVWVMSHSDLLADDWEII